VTLGGVIPFIIVTTQVGNCIKDASKELQDLKGELGQVGEECISNIRTVKAFACEKIEADRFH
jgi:ABC-type multidrug transport system fused ATPase/permease subunit